MSERQPLLEENFLKLLGQFTAGDPMREGVVRQMLRRHRLGTRKARKKKALGTHPDRNAQFLTIDALKAQHLASGDPVISIDRKKKGLIGNFSREGRTHTQTLVETLAHDFPTAGKGKLIPHGIYD